MKLKYVVDTLDNYFDTSINISAYPLRREYIFTVKPYQFTEIKLEIQFINIQDSCKHELVFSINGNKTTIDFDPELPEKQQLHEHLDNLVRLAESFYKT